MMIIRLIFVVTALSTVFCLEITPQLCLNVKAGGLDCRCTTSLSDPLPWSDVDCSSRNISALSSDWQISQMMVKLDLSRNRLSSLTSEQFAHWGNLEELILSRNLLTVLKEDVFGGLTNLEVLDLSYNLLTTLPSTIFNSLPILASLNLEKNKLQEINPQTFSKNPHLDTLTLDYNPSLGKYLISFPHFLAVALENNLTTLSLNNMSIDKIPNGLFDDTTGLLHLSLADNPLRYIGILPASLESLNLSGIHIEVLLPGDFIYYPRLKILQLDRLLYLTEVEENAFEGLRSLEILSMENCIQLHIFHEFSFGGIESKSIPLQKLSLARSGLDTLSPNTFLTVERTIKHVDLQGNPWRCDCNLAWIGQLNFSLHDSEYLRCLYPEKHRNKLLLSLKTEEFVCEPPEEIHPYSVMMVMLDVFLIVFVVVFSLIILTFLWRRDFFPCSRRLAVGRYSQVTIEPNRAELEWDDKDLDHIWSTPPVTRHENTKGS